jgi:deoxyribose-phosphate aldolase
VSLTAPVAELARCIEHTLLRASATPADIEQLCAEAAEHGFHGVCVNPCHVARASQALRDLPPRVVSVAAFPLGATVPDVAAREAAQAVTDGASEIDLVIPIGLAIAGELARVADFVGTVRQAIAGVTLKVILETGYFASEQVAALAEAVLGASPEFLKTSTGFGPRGATVQDVRLLAGIASGRARIKAAGGIRTLAQASAMLQAGAARIGTSSGVAIVGG